MTPKGIAFVMSFWLSSTLIVDIMTTALFVPCSADVKGVFQACPLMVSSHGGSGTLTLNFDFHVHAPIRPQLRR